MSLTDESTVAERLAYVDRIKAEAQSFAAKIKHRNREYRRTRRVAVMLISEVIGADYSEEQLRKSGCPYIRVGRTPLYRDSDLRALSESILDRALGMGSDPRSLVSALPEKLLIENAAIRRGRRCPRSRRPPLA